MGFTCFHLLEGCFLNDLMRLSRFRQANFLCKVGEEVKVGILISLHGLGRKCGVAAEWGRRGHLVMAVWIFHDFWSCKQPDDVVEWSHPDYFGSEYTEINMSMLIHVYYVSTFRLYHLANSYTNMNQ